MIETWFTAVRKITGDEPRKVYVYVPDRWHQFPEERYPVLYMFDGHNVFFDEDATYGKSWGMREYLDAEEVPLIVVAVDCNHHPDNGRLSEYSPFDFSDRSFGEVKGRGKVFMDWLTRNLKPKIDKRYPTLRGRRNTFIAGSSMGGLMSLYALLAYNRVFSRAAALSPSIWVDPRALKELVRTAEVRKGTVLYMDYGSREMGNHRGIRRGFGQMASLLIDKGLYVNARIVPNGDHCEACWEEQIPFFMQTIFYERD